MPPFVLSLDLNLSYLVKIEGIADRDLQRLLEDSSHTFSLKERIPASVSALERRVSDDLPRMLTVLRSQGFYSALIEPEIERKGGPVTVIFRIHTGSPYLIEYIDFKIEGDYPILKDSLPSTKDLGLFPGAPAKNKDILAAKDAIKSWLERKGFPFAAVEIPKVIVDHSKKSLSVTYHLHPGSQAYFGTTVIEGIETVDESFIRQKIPWNEGDLFNRDYFSGLKRELLDTGLFATIDITNSENLNGDARLPVFVKLTERKHRTFKTGIGFRTDEGPEGKVSWENRNFFNKGENLSLTGNVSGIGNSVKGSFRRPWFIRPDQLLLLNAHIGENNPDVFKSKNISGSAEVRRSLSKGLFFSAGIGLKNSKINQYGDVERFNLISFPLSLNWDTRNDLLDPIEGGQFSVQFIPYQDTFDRDLRFIKGGISYSRYFRLINQESDCVLAVKGGIGALEGASVEEIPADIRFYAGGSGSVRGYPFKSIGGNRQERTMGGRSLFTLSTELRTRLTETLGAILFLDGGTVSESAFPDSADDVYWGAGLGVRYFTAAGPLRFDVGIPLNRRAEIDDPFQIYISLGQTF